jgi:hypothetical protein
VDSGSSNQMASFPELDGSMTGSVKFDDGSKVVI